MKVALLGPLLISALWSQAYRATLLGTVTDPAGAAAEGAAVVVTNNGSGVSSRTLTNHYGRFQVPYPAPGMYSVEVAHAGFKTHRRGPIELHVDGRVKVHRVLGIRR